jgi:hypothetical protein
MTDLPAQPSPMDLRDRIVAELARRLGKAARSVAAHGGSFDEQELKRYALEAPAVRVVLVGMGRVGRYGTGEMIAPLHFAAVCVARDEAKAGVGVVGKDAACAALAASVALIVDANRWGWGATPEGPGMVGAPLDLEARNEYSGSLDNKGVALWQVTWTHELRLGRNRYEALAALADLLVNDEPFVAGADPIAHPAEPAP